MYVLHPTVVSLFPSLVTVTLSLLQRVDVALDEGDADSAGLAVGSVLVGEDVVIPCHANNIWECLFAGEVVSVF